MCLGVRGIVIPLKCDKHVAIGSRTQSAIMSMYYFMGGQTSYMMHTFSNLIKFCSYHPNYKGSPDS